MARRTHGRRWAHDGERARSVAQVQKAAAHRYRRWTACRFRCPRRRAGPARRAPRSPQDSSLPAARLNVTNVPIRDVRHHDILVEVIEEIVIMPVVQLERLVL